MPASVEVSCKKQDIRYVTSAAFRGMASAPSSYRSVVSNLTWPIPRLSGRCLELRGGAARRPEGCRPRGARGQPDRAPRLASAAQCCRLLQTRGDRADGLLPHRAVQAIWSHQTRRACRCPRPNRGRDGHTLVAADGVCRRWIASGSPSLRALHQRNISPAARRSHRRSQLPNRRRGAAPA